MNETTNLEQRIHEIGMQLFDAMHENGRIPRLTPALGSRALQRRALERAAEDPHFKARLFRFIDVYPSLRDSGDLVRHLRAYLEDRGELPRPLDRLVGPESGKRLPSWLVARLTERTMQRMAKNLIPGRDATEVFSELKRLRRQHTAFTLDILGEACLSEAEAADYAKRYADVLETLPPKMARWEPDQVLDEAPWGEVPRVNLSLKLSSLYSQIDPADFEGSRSALVATLRPLFLKAREQGVFMNIDLERFAHRDLTYAVFSDLALDPRLSDYPHLGIVVQAYLRDSADDVDRLIGLARQRGTPVTVRLVKGAYWDYESITARQEHWPLPVFESKTETDTQFERLAKVLIENWEWTRPTLGTHNIRSMAAALAAAETAGLEPRSVELQVLYGMAEPIRRAAVSQRHRVREYVPVGEMIPGMAYLVRRLLENTSNESFLRLASARQVDPDLLLATPGVAPSHRTENEVPATATPPATADAATETSETDDAAEQTTFAVPPLLEEAPQAVAPAAAGPSPMRSAARHERLPDFQNEPHCDFSRSENRAAMEKALATITASLGRDYSLLINGFPVESTERTPSVNPARPDEVVGLVAVAAERHADQALAAAQEAFPAWRDTPCDQRADILIKAAALMRRRRFELAALEVVEAGKPWREADADVTEAIDFMEYYAREMIRLSTVRDLSDVPGEEDLFFYEPRGVAAVIAPWNFPLAIPTGMVSAALVAGNTVVFKPATPTPVLGYALVRILHEAGLPGGAISYLPGPGREIGDYLSADPRVDLIAFTGSLEVGTRIMQRAAVVAPGQRNIKRVIAELGGKNAIIVDTDADLDAAVEGTMVSAFGYAGQKCSACSRVIVLESVYDQFVRRLTQAVASLEVGDPADPAVKVGPVISEEAMAGIASYIEKGKSEARTAYPMGDVSALSARSPETASGGAASVQATSAKETAATSEDVAVAEQDPAKTAETDAPTPTPGYFVLPHLFVEATPEAVIAQEEIFGPVLVVLKVRKFGEALDLALRVRYGLTGGLYSRNPNHIRRAVREFRVGNLYINRPITGAMVGRQPFGGSRMSGVGSKAGGPDYLVQFMEPRTVTENTVRRGFAPPLQHQSEFEGC